MSDQIRTVLEQIESDRSDFRVLVVGDVMIDQYLWGEVERVSPEAPVPVVRHDRETVRPGGASNVAANLTGLGNEVELIGYVGTDDDGQKLKELLARHDIDTRGAIRVEDRPTIRKTRIIGSRQQIVRLDREDTSPLSPEQEEHLLNQVEEGLGEADAVIVSDYAKGTITERICQGVIARAHDQGKPVLVDPKGDDYSRYRGATAVTPNHHELARSTGAKADHTETLIRAAQDLCETLDVDCFIVTRGKEGISLVRETTVEHHPAVARDVYDVSGAGDTVVAAIVHGRMRGADWGASIRLANAAAGIVIEKLGTVPITKEELIHEFQAGRIGEHVQNVYDWSTLQHRLDDWRARGDQIVFTNGCFDLLHAGHVTYLEAAAELGDRLIVGLNTDRSVQTIKGPPRPIIPEEQRARVLSSLESVDAVVLFDEETPLRLIQKLRPDVLVKGEDYTKEEVVGAEEVEDWGGTVELAPLVDGLSTSKIINNIRKTSGATSRSSE